VKVAFCQCTYHADYQDTLKCVERVAPYVDYVIIVEDGTLTDEQRQKLRQFKNLILKTVEFKDNIPEFRNQYIEEAKRLGVDWVCVSDPDELYSESLVKDLRQILEWAEANGINMLGVNCREYFENIEWLDELDLIKEVPGGYRESNFWKTLIFKVYPDLRYEGVGRTKTVHETWRSSVPWRTRYLPKKYYYEHRKSAFKIWRNAARNLFMGGGGDNVGELNPFWVELRKICDELGIKNWRSFEEYCKKGKIHPKLKDWMVKALSAPPTNWGTETRETAKWYFAMHRDEITPEILNKLKNPPKLTEREEIEHYVTKCYFDILGRHPDEKGKNVYVNAILQGKIKKEDLPKILRSSPEYREKFGLASPAETVRIPVPVNVDIQLTAETFLEALMKSKTYWEEIKPKLVWAEKWERLLSVSKKVETGGKGVDLAKPENFKHFVEILLKYCPPNQYPRVLDIGAGCGAETKALKDAGYQVIGITFGEDNIKYAKSTYGLDLIEMDMHNLQFPEGYFDLVFVIQTFEHALSPWMLILEIRRVLRDGGRVFIEVPDPDDEEMLKIIWHTSVLYPNQIKALFWKAGFKEVADLNKKHRLAFLFEKIPDGKFEMWGYVKYMVGKA